jgi:signal peptidase I
LALVLLLALATVVRTGLATPVRISSGSMSPTLLPGDVVITSRAALAVGELERNDLVTFSSPQDGERALKRVVGLPGDRVVIKDAVLHVDDRPVEEPWVDHERIDAYYSETYVVPEGSVLVLGDNRANSTDSRDYGPVDADDVTGRVLVRLWPPVRH